MRDLSQKWSYTLLALKLTEKAITIHAVPDNAADPIAEAVAQVKML